MFVLARLCATTSVIALVCAVPAAAQTISSDSVIVTGSKFSDGFGGKSGIPIEKVPQSVQVITAKEMVDQGATSMGDLLRNVPSANAGFSRVGPYQSFSLKIRGFLADQMRNGMRQRYYEDVDASALSNIERVEVLKGPSGVLYGHSAVGGIISIITKAPQAETAGSLALTVGSYGQKVASFDVTGAIAPGLMLRANGEIERSGTFVDFQDMDRMNGAFSVRYEAAHWLTANLVAEYVERETKHYPGLPIPGTVESNGAAPLRRGLQLGEPSVANLRTHAPLVQAWVEMKLSDSWTLTPRFQYQQFNTNFTQIRLRTPQPGLTVINRNGRTGREDDEYMISQIDLGGSFDTMGLGHKILTGYEYGLEGGRFTQFDLTNVGPIDVLNPAYTYAATAPARTFAFDIRYNNYTHALYFQDQIALTERLDVVAAVRQSWIATTDKDFGGPPLSQSSISNTIWSLGSTYRLDDVWSVYAGYNTGFDIESTAGARSANGAPLEPEESRQAEIGLRLRTGDFSGSLALFQVERTNALTTDPLNPNFSLNVGEQRVQGFELEGAWQALPGWSINGGYAYLDSEITRSNNGDQGRRIGDVPAHSVTLSTDVALPGTELILRGGVNYVSDRLLVNGSNTTLPDYAIVHLGAGYQLGQVSLNLTVNNLFNERYFTASGNAFAVMPGEPRTISLRAGVSL